MDLPADITAYLKELHMPTIRALFTQMAETARNSSQSYEEYLFELLREEIQVRRQNRIERLLRESRLPMEKNFDTFELKRLGPKLTGQVNILKDGSFLDRSENVLAFGNPGSGKTHLVCALGQELIRHGYRVIFYSTAILVQRLLMAKRELRLERFIKSLAKYDALVIDDIGYVEQSREEMEVLFGLFAERYERGSIILTSNLPFSKWEKIFKDPMTAAAAIDRLIHHSIILELNLPSYRLEQSKDKHAKGGHTEITGGSSEPSQREK